MGAPEHCRCDYSLLLLLLVIVSAVSAGDLFDAQLGDITSCSQQCQFTFKHKSSNEVSTLK